MKGVKVKTLRYLYESMLYRVFQVLGVLKNFQTLQL